MAKSISVKCPACRHPVPGKIVGWFSNKRLELPNFCGSCATELTTTCSNCQTHLLELMPFCPNCRAQLNVGSPLAAPSSQLGIAAPPSLEPPAPAAAIARADEQMLIQLRRDNDDVVQFFGELLRVIVRLNPINIQLHEFHATIDEINESTERARISVIVHAALGAVDLSNPEEALQDTDRALTDIMTGIFSSDLAQMAPTFPDYTSYVHLGYNPDEYGVLAASRLNEALQSTRAQLSAIQMQFAQLLEFYPRYESIMTRSGLIDMVVGFAAGFFGGEIGVAGSQAWEGWRDKGDEEFVNAFSGAVDEFSNIAAQFTVDTEAAAEPVIQQVLNQYAAQVHQVLRGIRSVALEGRDITPIFHAIRHADPVDDDARDLCELVLNNLREVGFTMQSEQNVRKLVGM